MRRRGAALRAIGGTFGAVALAVAATACSPGGSGAPQTLDISYGEGETAAIEFSDLRCTEAQGLRSFTGGGDVDGRAAVTVAVVDGQATVAVHVEDDRWFIGAGDADADEDSVELDGFTGSLVVQGADLDITEVVDDAATLSGSLHCG